MRTPIDVKVLRIFVDHSERIIDVSIGRLNDRGAFSYNTYRDISVESQERLVRLINSRNDLDLNWFDGRARRVDLYRRWYK